MQPPRKLPTRRRSRAPWAAAGLALAGSGLLACALVRPAPAPDTEVYLRAESERAERLEREVTRLKADLQQAEEAMVAIESGLRGNHTRADAVSGVADARIQVDRAKEATPWRSSELAEARSKLEEAERQLHDGHFGSAVFFASRAERISVNLLAEADQVAKASTARFVAVPRVNLRAGPATTERVIAVLLESTPVIEERREGEWSLVRTPAGEVGWIYAELLRGT